MYRTFVGTNGPKKNNMHGMGHQGKQSHLCRNAKVRLLQTKNMACLVPGSIFYPRILLPMNCMQYEIIALLVILSTFDPKSAISVWTTN